MSILDEFRRDEQRVLDHLVDGELNHDQRRELLGGLDDEPGAWRRCALAFLEAQSWGDQLSRLATEPALGNVSRSPVGRGKFWAACLAIAASVLVAFGLGTRFPASRSPQGAPSAPLAEADRGNTVQAHGELAAGESTADEASPYETVTLAPTDGGAAAQEIELAVVKDGATDGEWASAGQSTVASQVLQSLERGGLKVTSAHRLLPVDLVDGRRLIVPVDDVLVRDPEIVQY